jgi:hypothetical protein
MLLAAYFLEAGVVLLVVPWSTFWERNSFAAALPFIDTLLASPYTRGAVSGVGLVTMVAGLAEIGGAFSSRRHTSAVSPSPTLPSDR